MGAAMAVSMRTVGCVGVALLAGRAAAAQGTMEPELVQPGVISTDGHETFPAVDPVDGSLWFSRYEADFGEQVMMRAAWGDGVWHEPSVAWPDDTWGNRAPRFSPDGRRLTFSSNRPMAEGDQPGPYHLWVAERRGDAWSDPRPLPAPVNGAEGEDRHASLTDRGELYWSSTRPGGAGRSDVYHARASGERWSAAQRLVEPVNDALSQPDLLVSPDGSWMVLVITDHPDGLGGDDLFVSRSEDGQWTRPHVLPSPINSAEYEYGPTLSADGGTLYFTSHRRGSADVYRVPIAALGLGR
jgi:Tol biopolymer transport system component